MTALRLRNEILWLEVNLSQAIADLHAYRATQSELETEPAVIVFFDVDPETGEEIPRKIRHDHSLYPVTREEVLAQYPACIQEVQGAIITMKRRLRLATARYHRTQPM